MAHVIAVLNQKGGTSKTTSSVALAGRFAAMGKNVLLLDVDPQANTTLALGIDAVQVEKSTYDILVRDARLDDVITSTPIPKLHLAPGKVELSRTDINLADRQRKQFKLKDALKAVADRYEYVIIDCPPSFGLIPVNALVAANGVIIPLVPGFFALEGLKQVQGSIDNIRRELNPQLTITGILFSMVNPRLKITQPAIDMVRAHYQDQVFKTMIHVCSQLNESQVMGKSIFEYAPRSKAAVEYIALADEVIERTGGLRVDRGALAALKQIFHLS